MIDLRRFDDRLKFMMGIPIPIKQRLYSECHGCCVLQALYTILPLNRYLAVIMRTQLESINGLSC